MTDSTQSVSASEAELSVTPAQASQSEPAEDLNKALTKPLPKDLLLVVFIHGFKGTDTTFVDFPARLQHVLNETIENVVAECVIFPAYETKGELDAAVERFADWLTTLTVEREVANGEGGGAGKAKIVLCGHSMGGLLAADTLLAMVYSRPDKQAPLWPRIIACIAFDTPVRPSLSRPEYLAEERIHIIILQYFGLHPFVFKNSATKAAEYADTARSIASGIFSGFAALSASKATKASSKPPAGLIKDAPAQDGSVPWAKWASYGGAALAAGAAAGTAYYKREDLALGYAWATDHMKYVGNLWDEDKMRKRVESVIDVEDDLGVIFRTFYTTIPSNNAKQPPKTFIILPPKDSKSISHFTPAANTLAPDELQAHTGMFAAKTNDGYYALGLEASKIIREAINIGRGLVQDDDVAAAMEATAEGAMGDKIDMDGPTESKESEEAKVWMEKGAQTPPADVQV